MVGVCLAVPRTSPSVGVNPQRTQPAVSKMSHHPRPRIHLMPRSTTEVMNATQRRMLDAGSRHLASKITGEQGSGALGARGPEHNPLRTGVFTRAGEAVAAEQRAVEAEGRPALWLPAMGERIL